MEVSDGVDVSKQTLILLPCCYILHENRFSLNSVTHYLNRSFVFTIEACFARTWTLVRTGGWNAGFGRLKEGRGCW